MITFYCCYTLKYKTSARSQNNRSLITLFKIKASYFEEISVLLLIVSTVHEVDYSYILITVETVQNYTV